MCGLLSRDSGLNDAIVHEIVCRLLSARRCMTFEPRNWYL